jgi:hypothetical protein
MSHYFRPNDVSTQPTHWWKLNEEGGVNFVDSVSVNPITMTNFAARATATTGITEPLAARFITVGGNGSYGQSSVGGSDFDYSGGVFTHVMWVKADSLATDADLFGYYVNASNYCKLGCSAAGTLTFLVKTAASDVITVVSNAGVITVGSWKHIAIRENGNEFKIFVNAVDVTASGGTDADRLISYAASPVYLSSLLVAFNGDIQDFAIWKTYALTDQEIYDLKNLTLTPDLQECGMFLCF